MKIDEKKYNSNAVRVFVRSLADIVQDEERGEEDRAASIQIVVDLLVGALANAADLRNEALNAAVEAVGEKLIDQQQFRAIWEEARI